MTEPTQTMPSATVVIPTTGSGRVAEIAGLFSADRAVTEILVVVDNPKVRLDELQSKMPRSHKLKLIQNDQQLGLTRSLNRAIATASGDVIIRNDDDDMPDARRASELIEYFARHPECDLVCSFARGVDLDSGRSWLIDGPTTDAEIKRALAKRNFIVHSSLAFRKASTDAIGHYDETFKYAQDYDLYLRSIRRGLVFGMVARELVTRSYHRSSITVSRRRQQILCSFAARIIHDAETGDVYSAWRTIVTYTRLLLVPTWLRKLRRRAGYGR